MSRADYLRGSSSPTVQEAVQVLLDASGADTFAISVDGKPRPGIRPVQWSFYKWIGDDEHHDTGTGTTDAFAAACDLFKEEAS